MLVLLGLSTLAAALVGNRPLNDEGTGSTIASETETEPAPTDTVPAGELSSRAIEVGGKNEVEVVPMKVGDQLELTVSSPRSAQVEIPALGLLEPVEPGAPARFDILGTEPATYGVRLVEGDRVVARIEITARGRDASEAATPE